MREGSHGAALVLVVLAVLWPAALPGETASSNPDRSHSQTGSGRPGERAYELFPEGHLFSLAIADPQRPGAAAIVASYSSAEVDGGSDRRFLLRVGGRFGLVRRRPVRPEGRSWQLSLEAGLDAQFDMELGQDNIGWDGNYGLSLATARRDSRWAFLVGVLHTSSHIGDEWILRTGRERINYTREEVRAAVSRRLSLRWRTYAEAAHAYQRRAFGDLIQPLRAQWGLEFEAPGRFWNGAAGWYAATDLQTWEERDWRLDAALQAGLMFETGSRTWRIGLDFQDGRVPLGEFFQDTESAVSVGLWSEL